MPDQRARLKTLDGELVDLEKRSADMTTKWQRRESSASDAQKMKAQLEQLRTELSQRAGARWSISVRRAVLRHDPRTRKEVAAAAVEAGESSSIGARRSRPTT